jgi:aspartate carbamoyltransferase catalytic subunit
MSNLRVIRSQVRLLKSFDKEEEISTLSPEELLSSVWDLTEEIYSLTRNYDAQSRPQRDVVSLTRRED